MVWCQRRVLGARKQKVRKGENPRLLPKWGSYRETDHRIAPCLGADLVSLVWVHHSSVTSPLKDKLEAMPTQNKKNYNKRSGGKRGGRGRANFGMLVQVPALRLSLPYSYQGGLAEGAAAIGTAHSFAINNIFDPDFTGGGLQPLGLDQYTQLYGRYHVHGFKYELTFATLTAAPIFVGCYLSPQSTLPASAVAWFVVNGTVKTGTLGANTGGNNIYVLKGRANLKDVFGVTSSEYLADQDFGALVTSSPARQAYLHVWIVGRTVAASAAISVRLWYDVELSQPVALSMS